MVEELLASETVRAIAAFVVLPGILLLVLVATVYGLSRLLRADPEVEESEVRKYSRFESGNPEKGEAKARVSMQYLGYLIIFLAIEPVAILMALAIAAPRDLIGRLAVVFGVVVAVYAPFMVYAIKEAGRPERWMVD